jgi:hypothetical protein
MGPRIAHAFSDLSCLAGSPAVPGSTSRSMNLSFECSTRSRPPSRSSLTAQGRARDWLLIGYDLQLLLPRVPLARLRRHRGSQGLEAMLSSNGATTAALSRAFGLSSNAFHISPSAGTATSMPPSWPCDELYVELSLRRRYDRGAGRQDRLGPRCADTDDQAIQPIRRVWSRLGVWPRDQRAQPLQ